jgi:hypothetical protein
MIAEDEVGVVIRTRMIFALSVVVLSFLFERTAQGQVLAESFELGLPTSAPVTPTQHTLSSGVWTLYYAYQGSNTSYICSDGGAFDLRVQKTSIAPGGGYAISPTLNNGVGTVSFKEGRGSRIITVQKSTDNGVTWTTVGTPTSTQCVLNTVTVNDGAANRIKLWNASTSDEDIDNVLITGSAGVPGLTVNPTSLAFGNVIVNTNSSELTYTISGYSLIPLSGDIEVSAPTDFEVSAASGSGFAATLLLPYVGGVLSATTVYVRFRPSSAASYSASISNSGGGSSIQNVTVSGTGVLQGQGSGIYVSPSGSDSNPGTILLPVRNLARAVSMAGPDSQIFLRGGTYAQSSTQSVNANGTSGHLLKIWAYPGERPVLDFSGQTSGDGISLSGSYCHLRGIDVTSAYHNGINVSGHYNVIENCSVYDNRNSGFQMGSSSGTAHPRGNLILNCDSYRNYDAPIGGNADGYAVKWNIGLGNTFKGCRAWNNSDDGWDLWMADSLVVIDSCYAFRNGVDIWHSGSFNGNGNGFKLGGNSVATPNTVRNSVAFDNAGNTGRGFDENNNLAGQTLYNCTSYRNQGDNYHFTNSVTLGQHIIKNCISFGGVVNITSGTRENNSWQGFTVTNADFISLDTSVVTIARNPDGSLPRMPFARLAMGSSLIDAGQYIGLPFSGTAPDLGALEFDSVVVAIPGVFTTPTTIHFGSILVGDVARDTVNVKSVGLATLHVDSIRVRGNEFSGAQITSVVVLVGDSLLVAVTFNPTVPGVHNGLLVVYSDAPTSPDTVLLSGSGTQSAFSIFPNPWDFGNVNVGNALVDTLTVTNLGTAILLVDSVRTYGGEFTANPSNAFSIVPGNSVKVAVRFGPTSPGEQRGHVVFRSNSPLSPDSVSVVGVGISTAVSLHVPTLWGWNMVANPILTASDSVHQLYPASSFDYAFAFVPGSGYERRGVMENGLGYWATFPQDTTSLLVGVAVMIDTIQVSAGWNMIGSITSAVDTAAITTIPPGLRSSLYFGYMNGYTPTSSVLPGRAYWVKSSGNGSFILGMARENKKP